MNINTIENPFTGCTARDMTYEEISKYWCSPFELYSLNEVELFSSRTPIIIEGARGTGKTMLLKHLSYDIQKDNIQGESLADALNYFADSGIGVYFRYKEDFCNMFTRLKCNREEKQIIFECYYELFICRQIFRILSDIYTKSVEKENEWNCISHMNILLEADADRFEELYEFINEKVKKMDELIKDSIFEDGIDIEKIGKIKVNNLIKRIVDIVCADLEGWEKIQFNILLDEYENARDYQRMINTFIKQVDNTLNLSYRIGMRPSGMFDNGTYVAGEKIQIDRDFILYSLKCLNDKSYENFAIEVAEKRLKSVDFYWSNHLTDIRLFLGAHENLDEEAKTVAGERKHFQLLKKKYSSEAELENVISTISCDEKLMEMYNIIRIERGMEYHKIGEICKEYQRLRKEKKLKEATGEVKKYYLDYSNKYRMTLLYILLTIYGKKKMYYSLNTFLYLSSGSINDFISLCRNTFYFIGNEELRELKEGKTICPKIQTEGARRTANNQLRKVAMSNNYGQQMNSFIDNMGRLFGFYHQDLEARYPETNQFAFVDENAIYQDEELAPYVHELINSGAIIKPDKQQCTSVGKKKGYVYKLNRIFAPIYQFSYRTRGGFNVILNKEEFKNMLFNSENPQKFVNRNTTMGQMDLFEFMEQGAGKDE